MDHLFPWFSLKDVPGVGSLLYKRLIDRFGSPHRVLDAPVEELMQVEGVKHSLAFRIRNHRGSEGITDELERIRKNGCRIITLTDPVYPPLLREIPDPPPFLYVSGELGDTGRTLAVVGSRNATPYGISTTQRLCTALAERGVTVVSGMARGIDTAAHLGALMGGGRTLAVLGSGLERIYPHQNRDLFRKISENGAVISEFPLKTEPEAHNFPTRNRIISGISLGTVIVEATRKSGSLITARLAAEQNREVFAIPGSVHSFKSTGTHNLIKQGAKLVEHAQDILEEFPAGLFLPEKPAMSKKTGPCRALSADEQRVMRAFETDSTHIDDLVRKTGIPPGKLAGVLLNLELKGIVVQQPGKRFYLTSEAP